MTRSTLTPIVKVVLDKDGKAVEKLCTPHGMARAKRRADMNGFRVSRKAKQIQTLRESLQPWQRTLLALALHNH